MLPNCLFLFFIVLPNCFFRFFIVLPNCLFLFFIVLPNCLFLLLLCCQIACFYCYCAAKLLVSNCYCAAKLLVSNCYCAAKLLVSIFIVLPNCVFLFLLCCQIACFYFLFISSWNADANSSKRNHVLHFFNLFQLQDKICLGLYKSQLQIK